MWEEKRISYQKVLAAGKEIQRQSSVMKSGGVWIDEHELEAKFALLIVCRISGPTGSSQFSCKTP